MKRFPNKKCVICNKNFYTSPIKFKETGNCCSRNCRKIHSKNLNTSNIECKNCKKVFNRNNCKIKACNEFKINLIVIDISTQNKFTKKSSYSYLNTICRIIDQKLKEKES